MDKLQQLVARKCANYDNNGKCLIEVSEDDQGAPCRDCPLFNARNNRCLYFETSVLPEVPELERKYWEARGVVYRDLTKCNQCGELYKRTSNAQKYCTDCADFIRRLRRSEANRRNYQRRKANKS